jgi:hypothetical protein
LEELAGNGRAICNGYIEVHCHNVRYDVVLTALGQKHMQILVNKAVNIFICVRCTGFLSELSSYKNWNTLYRGVL